MNTSTDAEVVSHSVGMKSQQVADSSDRNLVSGNAKREGIAVIIPTFERPTKTLRALESVRQQTVAPDEILVIDDGSSKDSLNTLEGHLQPPERLISLGTNEGASRTRNRGIRESNARILLFLDSDDWWEPTHIATVLPFMGNQRVLMIAGGISHLPGGKLRRISSRKVKRVSRRQLLGMATKSTATSLLSLNVPDSQYLLEFDETLRVLEDLEFVVRASKNGYLVLQNNVATVHRDVTGGDHLYSNARAAKAISRLAQQHLADYRADGYSRLRLLLCGLRYALRSGEHEAFVELASIFDGRASRTLLFVLRKSTPSSWRSRLLDGILALVLRFV